MTVDLQISDTISAKEKKEKKERKRKDKTAKKDVEDNVGTGAVEKSNKKKHKKRNHATAAETTAQNTEVDGMDVDLGLPETGEKKSKKKRKREEDGEGALEGSSRKDKKKRKKEPGSVVTAEAERHAAVQLEADEHKESSPSKAKKDKKSKDKKKKGAESDENTSVPSSSTPSLSRPTPSSSEVEAYLTKNEITLHAPDGCPPVPPILSFDQLAVPPELRSAFTSFKDPTPIQACSWPHALAGRDVVGIAETGRVVWDRVNGSVLFHQLLHLAQYGIDAGRFSELNSGISAISSEETYADLGKAFWTYNRGLYSQRPSCASGWSFVGKTLAFGLPALARLVKAGPPPKKAKGTAVSVLVVAPTRELALQTHETLEKLGTPLGIASVAVFGGVDKAPQVKALKGRAQIVVGTPGRILDLANDGVCDLSRVSYLVLDEADRMLDKGFENDIRAIIGQTMAGSERQTLMFSATWPDAVRRLAATFQRDPVRVTVGSDDLTANSRVEQVVEVFDDPREKDSRLLGHLRTLKPKKAKGGASEDPRVLVFALYKKEAERVEGMLRSKGFAVGGLHGDLSQAARLEALQSFKTGTTTLLVATDVAARGLDIPNVGAVINYTFPLTIEDYIHRIGRTGRGGKSGKSITFFTGEKHERALAGELARVLRESGFEAEGLKKFPMTVKKKTHSAYGAFFRDDIPVPSKPTKITF